MGKRKGSYNQGEGPVTKKKKKQKWTPARKAFVRVARKLPGEIWLLIMEKLPIETLKAICTVNGSFHQLGRRVLWRHLRLDVRGAEPKSVLRVLKNNRDFLEYIQTVHFSVENEGRSRRSFQALLDILPANKLKSISFNTSSSLSDFSLRHYIRFLRSTELVTKAVIPKRYNPDVPSDADAAVPEIRYTFTFARSRLQNLVFLGTDIKELVRSFVAEDAPIVEVDLWGNVNAYGPMAEIDAPMARLLAENLPTIRAMRFSCIYLGPTDNNTLVFGQKEAPSLKEIHMLNCDDIYHPLQQCEYKRRLQTLLIEDTTPVSLDPQMLISTLSDILCLENLSIQSSVSLIQPPELDALLRPHSALKKLVLRLRSSSAESNYITAAIASCPDVTHLGLPEPLYSDCGDLEPNNKVLNNWLRAASVSGPMRMSGIKHLHIFFREPESLLFEKWYGNCDRRQRDIVRALHEHFAKDGNPVEEISVSIRRPTYRCCSPAPKAQIFQRSGKLLQKSKADWTEFGGYRRLPEFLEAEFGKGYNQV